MRIPKITTAALVAPVFVAVAIGVQEGLDENTGETFLALFFVVVAGPFLSHATIRAIGVRERGDWRRRPARRDKPAEVPDRVREKTP